MTASRHWLILALLLACAPALAADKVYKWTDENGVVHYSAKPPEETAAESVDIRRGPPAPAPVVDREEDATEETLRAAECTRARARLQVLLANELVDLKDASGNVTRLSAEQRQAEIDSARRDSDQWCASQD